MVPQDGAQHPLAELTAGRPKKMRVRGVGEISESVVLLIAELREPMRDT